MMSCLVWNRSDERWSKTNIAMSILGYLFIILILYVAFTMDNSTAEALTEYIQGNR